MTVRLHATLCASLGLVLVAAATSAAAAQGYGRGMGRRGGGEQSEERHQSDDPAADLEKRFQDMAATKPVLKDVKLDHAEKDSIGRIEKTYQNRFLSYSIAAKHLFEDAKAQGAAPDFQQLQQLREDARKLQDQEYGELRAVIAEDQRGKFDANIKEQREREDKNAPARPRQPASP
jgi:hypothetical protein